MNRKETEILRPNVATILEIKREQNISHTLIMKEAVTEGSPLYRALKNGKDYEKELDNFMRCVLDGYEIDEREAYEKIGLWHHPYQKRDWIEYAPTFVILTYMHEDFTGRIWLPYASKLEYGANVSFVFKQERLASGNSRIDEIHLAPQWFQELFQQAESYINKRNKQALAPYEEMLQHALEETKELSEEEFKTAMKKEGSFLSSILREGHKMKPLLMKRLQETKDTRICYLLEEVTGLVFYFNMHDEKEEMEAYQNAKKDSSKLISLWMTWGKHYL